ncbi:hypothetical protein GCM10010440_32420 [Kitasatospora cinereorecta]
MAGVRRGAAGAWWGAAGVRPARTGYGEAGPADTGGRGPGVRRASGQGRRRSEGGTATLRRRRGGGRGAVRGAAPRVPGGGDWIPGGAHWRIGAAHPDGWVADGEVATEWTS